MIETCDHGNVYAKSSGICDVTDWSSSLLDLSGMINKNVSKQNKIIRALKDGDSGVHFLFEV